MPRAAFAALVSSSFALAACGGTVVFDEDGSEGTGGAGDGGAPSTSSTAGPTTGITSGPTTSGPTTSGPTTTGPTSTGIATSGPVTTGPSGGICGTGVTLFFGEYDACLGDACCVEFDDCTRQGSDVLGCQNCLDGFGGECRAALECAEGCLPSGGECNSGLEPQLDQPECLSEACCAEMMFCTSNGPRLDDCLECLQGDFGPRCEPFVVCYEQSCDDVEGICSTGITTQDPAADRCLSRNCCAEFIDCTDDGNDVQACIDCIIDGGGPLCEAAVQCNEDFGCFGL